ncbi:chemotaxis protein CheA, partial [Pseudoxanthomonas jiangsuensis]|uniref:Hpt domain-containing protein n=1 Tax=Pseudoxanthomonas jiangsuensis TaxID=619688 RepID=UPI001B8691AB
MSMDLQRFHATYFEESREGLDAMEAGLLALEGGSLDPEVVNSVFRAAHSIKGGAATFGFEKMASLTHVLETLLDEIRAGKRALAASAVDAMLGSVDVLRALLAEAELGKPADPAAVAAVHARLQQELGGGGETKAAAAAEPEPEGWNIAFAPAPSLFMSGNDPLRIIRELENLGPLDVNAKLDRLPGFAQMDPLEACIAWDLGLRGKVPRSAIDDVFAWVVDDCELDIQPQTAGTAAAVATAPVVAAVPAANAPAGGDGSSLPVSGHTGGALINLGGGAVLTPAPLKQVSGGMGPAPAAG